MMSIQMQEMDNFASHLAGGCQHKQTDNQHNPDISVTDSVGLETDNCDLCDANWNSEAITIQSQYHEQLDVDFTLVESLKQLLQMYSMHVSESTSHPTAVSAGGMQQYLNKAMAAKKSPVVQQPVRGEGSDHTTFHNLPDSIQLHIFSFLGAADLCRISQVCFHWFILAADDLLWRHLLQRTVSQWSIIGHTTNPDMYKECQSDWSSKEIYLKCSPAMNHMRRQDNTNFHQLSSLLRSFWPKKTPKLTMFGPGLESSTSRICRKMLEDTTGMFKAIGMFPGQFEGVGSGFTMKMKSSLTFNLVTLYTSTWQERNNFQQGERLQGNRLLVHPQPAAQGQEGDEEEGEVEEEESHEVTRSIKELCRTLDGFLFVVNASLDEQTAKSAKAELFAMVNELWASPSVPVVVLSCIPEGATPRMSCIDIVRLLQLRKLNRPWQVHNCTVDTMEGVTGAIEWVVEHAQRR